MQALKIRKNILSNKKKKWDILTCKYACMGIILKNFNSFTLKSEITDKYEKIFNHFQTVYEYT